MEVYLEWIVNAWDRLPLELICRSFKTCGITINTDSSEDEMVRCFKSQGPIPEGLKFLKEKSMADALAPEVIPEDEHDPQEEAMMEVRMQQVVDGQKETTDDSDASDDENE